MPQAAWVTPFLALALPVCGQQDFSKVEIRTAKLADHVYMMTGAGGNLGVCSGEDGVFLIDDQFAPLTEKIRAAVAKISEKPIRFVLNTHWHGDHTGGNENLGKAGAVIVAHENVRKRMSTEQFQELFKRKTPPAPAGALPIVTFTDKVTFYLNGDDIEVFHVEHAHTDGDSIIRFAKANVVHMGDVFFNGMYPFIDTSSGGSIQGVIAAVEKVLEMTDGETKFIPGHGPQSGRKELEEYLAMLKGVRTEVGKLADAGKSIEEAIAAKPTKDFDAKWGNGFMKPDVFATVVYQSLRKK
ncbi:MAG: MBL fold metallo-hydrolase [Planctomycetes bacterium]|nr:MBL fold metallo-hydrolase [Planctomycetota bacterium]